ncbi:MAG: acyl-protein synthetase, partial [Proteobacteria bacterium]|nr:acyl-protein synthetase [Pseudomonadota bacterium]
SWIQTGGGWKGFANEEVSKEVFRSFISQHLGLPEENIRDMFGMVEHGIPYCDCKKGKFHIPNYARVFIRSPRDLSLMSGGETGLIHFLCSYVTSYPSISLLTTDYGRIGSCDCGLGGETLEIVGRAGISKHKGCALTASKLLDASSN